MHTYCDYHVNALIKVRLYISVSMNVLTRNDKSSENSTIWDGL